MRMAALTAHDWQRVEHTLSSPSAGSSNFWAVILYMRSPRRDLIMLNVIFCPSLVLEDDLSTACARHSQGGKTVRQHCSRQLASCNGCLINDESETYADSTPIEKACD